MARVAGAIVSVNATVLVCTGEPESLTAKVIDELKTAAVGVPEITPVAAARDNPAGRLPAETLHEYGVRPPVADRTALYAAPTVPLGTEVVPIVRAEAEAAIVIVSATDWVCAGDPASWTATVNEAFAMAAVGVPEITPVDWSSDNPGGSVPLAMIHINGAVPPAATTGALYGVPVIPDGTEVVAMLSGAGAMVSCSVVVFICTGDPESWTTSVSDTTVATEGVPEIIPVSAESASPAGIAPLEIDQLRGLTPPAAARLAEYAEPTRPLGSAVVEIDSAVGVGVGVTLLELLQPASSNPNVQSFAMSRTNVLTRIANLDRGTTHQAPALDAVL
jgi:hypothetical protein